MQTPSQTTRSTTPSYLKNRKSNQGTFIFHSNNLNIFFKKTPEFDIYGYKNGIYQGDFFDFKREGYGVYIWDDGQIYIGEWKDDQIEGMGIVFFGFGGYVYGKFIKNKLNGPGIVTFPNGDIYACAKWEAGKLDGRCLKYYDEEKTWKYIRYMYTVELEGPIDNENIYKEFLEIKQEILKKSEIPFEYKVNILQFTIILSINFFKKGILLYFSIYQILQRKN